MRYTVGLIVFFVVFITLDVIAIALAVSGDEPVAASYEREAR
jgi:hypothetical protein